MEEAKDEVSQSRNNQPNFRVKLYLLNEAGNWEDCGTGILNMISDVINDEERDFFQVISDSEHGPPSLAPELLEKLQKIKSDKSDERCLLYRPLAKDNQYERQGGNIIPSKPMSYNMLARVYNLMD